MNAVLDTAVDDLAGQAALADSSCYHCGLALADEGAPRTVVIDGLARAMCCPGCEAVARAIVDLGQSDYYRTRSGFGANAGALVPPALALYDHELERHAIDESSSEALLAVDGIRCAACVWLIEKQLAALPGVRAASLNVATERLYVCWDSALCKPSDIFDAIHRVGYAAYFYDAQRHGEQLQRSAKSLSRQLFVAGLCMMQVMMYAVPAYLADDGTLDAPMAALLRWASLLLTLPAVCYSALPFFRGAVAGLRARMPGMDVPVALGIAAAFGASVVATARGQGEVYFDSVTMFIFLLLCGRYLELTARRKAAGALERIGRAQPDSALRMAGYPGDPAVDTVAAQTLAVGDVILVRSGDAVAADGVVLDGDTHIDLALLSGESAPQARTAGDAVPGGAINVGAPFVLRVTHTARESTLSELVKLIERAGRHKPQLALWADLVASRFVLALLAFAAIVFGVWEWIDAARAWPIAIAVLVVSCPCALSLAMPTVLAAATDRLLRRGVLVVQAHTLETLHRATHIVFDKTGTLTVGAPRLQGIDVLGEMPAPDCLALAARLEAASAHPLARALLAAAQGEQGGAPAMGAGGAKRLREVPGQGLEGMIAGCRYRIGTPAFVSALAGGAAHDFEAGGGTTVFLGSEHGWLARFQLADALRPEAAATVRHFQQAGKTVLILSGDDNAVTAGIGARLGIMDARGALLPDQKLAVIKQLQQDGAVVAMVGDGINDAAVLSAADVSFAMGAGAALAQVNADAVLLSGRLDSLSETAQVGARAMRIIRQNLVWATLYNAVAIPAAALGLINPWMSGLGMTLSSALVVLNALRVRTGKAGA
ncbi:MAG: heavy metal translocating P-type ATPase [Pseudomonadota bacterium]